ncbi:MAG: opacity protein-like surface antigen [Roseivirga sp.]|jgi:opacity protein-like surface antigen
MHKFLFFSALFFLSFYAHSQSTLGFNLNGFLPMGELKRDSPEIWGGGISLDVAVQLKDSPIHIGGLYNMTRYGSEVRDGFHGPNLGDVRVRRNNELVGLLGFVRVKPQISGNFQPYADFLTGFNYIFTRSNFRDSSLDAPFDSVVDINDFVLNFGAGGGLEIFLNDLISLDFSFRALRSSRAKYLTPQSVTYNTDVNFYEFDVKRARFNHLSFGVGFKFLLESIY